MDAQGKQAKAAGQAGAYGAAAAEYNAEQIRLSSIDTASRIMEEAGRIRGTQQAQQAASGVVIGEGSAGVITQETENLASRDALVTLYSGIDGIIQQEQSGRMAFASAQNEVSSLKAAQMATLLTGIGNTASQYGTYKALKTPRT